MYCYVCTKHGVDRPAVALCRSCSAGLCVEHLRETAARFESDNILAACHHDTWRATDTISTSKTARAAIEPPPSRLAPTPGPSRVRRAWRRRGLARHG
jgi:hypothetical protein